MTALGSRIRGWSRWRAKCSRAGCGRTEPARSTARDVSARPPICSGACRDAHGAGLRLNFRVGVRISKHCYAPRLRALYHLMEDQRRGDFRSQIWQGSATCGSRRRPARHPFAARPVTQEEMQSVENKSAPTEFARVFIAKRRNCSSSSRFEAWKSF